MTKHLDCAASACAVLAAIMFGSLGFMLVAGSESLAAVGLVVSTLNNMDRVRSGFRLLLLLQVLALGVIWPSALTIAAAVTLPAIYICLRGLFASRADRVAVTIYSAASGLVAAGALLAEAITLSMHT